MLTNVIYARVLDLPSIGIVGLSHALAICATVFCDRGIGTWITRELHSGRISYKSAVAIAGRAAAVPYLGFSVVVFFLLWTDSLAELWIYSLMYSLPIALSYWSFQLALSCTQGLDRPHVRSSALIGNALLTVVLSAVALSISSRAVSAILATALAYLIVGAFVLFFLRQGMSASFMSLAGRKVVLRESRKLFWTNVSVFSMSSGDVLVAGFVLSPANLGVYQLVKKISQGLILPLLSVLPILLGKASRFGRQAVGRYLFRGILMGVGYSVLAIFVSIFAMGWLLDLLYGAGFDEWKLVGLVMLLAFSMQLIKDAMVVFFNASRVDTPPVLINLLVLTVFLSSSIAMFSEVDLLDFVWTLSLAYGCGVFMCLLYAPFVRGWSLRYSAILALLCMLDVGLVLFGVHLRA
jgi:O-antigen/teichoic acid export membrane protein